MFFKKKKPKLDPKVRFQHKQFTSKLDNARNFKRSNKAVPESFWLKALQKAGLSGMWSQIAAGVLLLGLLYLIYVPNLLSVKEVVITGISNQQSQQLEAAIREEIRSVSIVNPQYNLIFFDTDLVTQAAAKIPTIDYVASIKKDFKHQAIYVDAASKYERFLVSESEAILDVYNDGTVKGQSGISLDAWQDTMNPNMVKIKMPYRFNYQQYQALFTPQLLGYLNKLIEHLPTVTGQQLAYVTFKEPVAEEPVPEEPTEPLPEDGQEPSETVTEQPILAVPTIEEVVPETELPFSSSEVHLVFYKNNDLRRTYTVIMDATADAAHDLSSLNLLLSQTAPDRYNQLYYIDMRIPEKAYLCLESAPCTK